MNLLDNIQTELNNRIDDLISYGYTADCLSSPLTHVNDWYDMKPYDKMIIDFDGFKGTFKNALRFIEQYDGFDKQLNYDLIHLVSTTIESRWDIKQRHEQEDYIANYQYELQEVVGL